MQPSHCRVVWCKVGAAASHSRLCVARCRGGIELRPVGGTIKSDGQSLTFDSIKGNLGGGDVTADIDARPGLSGLALNARLSATNVDGAALRYRTLMLPGRASLKMTLTSQGRSAEALAGALSGDGPIHISRC